MFLFPMECDPKLYPMSGLPDHERYRMLTTARMARLTSCYTSDFEEIKIGKRRPSCREMEDIFRRGYCSIFY